MLGNGHIKFKKSLAGREDIDLFYDFDSSKLSRMDCGGRLFCLAVPERSSALESLLKNCIDNRLGFYILGDCTNTLISDRFHDEVFIKLGKGFREFEDMGQGELRVGASYDMQRLVVKSAKLGMDSSFMAGIPGTLGGAVNCNSGPNGNDIGSHVLKIEVMKVDNSEIYTKELVRDELRFAYRKLDLSVDEIIINIFLKFPQASDQIFDSIREIIKNKKRKQPIATKNLGCFFKNPKKGLSAGKLIEQAGFKGFKYGGAAVSELHANYIENINNASYRDIVGLANIIKADILKRKKIRLELEVRTIE
jgi:UDP-N-acetylmuramate dehydrogenase